MKSFKYMLFTLLLVSMGMTQNQQVSFIANINDYPTVGYNDVWGYTMGDGFGQEFALLGVINGTSVVDVSDPQNIQEVGFIPGSSSTWKDIKTYQSYAYVVTETPSSMQIIDLSFLLTGETMTPG